LPTKKSSTAKACAGSLTNAPRLPWSGFCARPVTTWFLSRNLARFERRGCCHAGVARDEATPQEDKDFGDLVFRRERTAPGGVLLRIGSENPALKAIRLQAAIDRYGDGLLGRYTVIEGGRFRSRPLWSTTSP
jgi:hypothetical protein